MYIELHAPVGGQRRQSYALKAELVIVASWWSFHFWLDNYLAFSFIFSSRGVLGGPWWVLQMSLDVLGGPLGLPCVSA